MEDYLALRHRALRFARCDVADLRRIFCFLRLNWTKNKSIVRWSAYRALQAGSFGFTYGSHGLWYPTQNEEDSKVDVWGERTVWWKALKRPGGAQMAHLKKCYESVEWWKLEPRPDVVKTAEELKEHQRILTKADGDRVFVIYFPRNTQSIKATLTGLKQQTEAAVYSVELFNPRTSSVEELNRIAVTESELALPNRPSAEDWLFILRELTTDSEDYTN